MVQKFLYIKRSLNSTTGITYDLGIYLPGLRFKREDKETDRSDYGLKILMSESSYKMI